MLAHVYLSLNMVLQIIFREFAGTSVRTPFRLKRLPILRPARVFKYVPKDTLLKIRRINVFKYVSQDMPIITVDIVLLNAQMTPSPMERQMNLAIKYVFTNA